MIIYYSLSGATKVYAELLAELTKDEIFELREKRPRSGAFGIARGVVESLFGLPVELAELPEIPAGKPIFICSPIWAGSMTPAAMTFIKKANLAKKKVNVILTCASVTDRGAYEKKAADTLIMHKCTPGFVQAFTCDRKAAPDTGVIRKRLKKLVLNVDESF